MIAVAIIVIAVFAVVGVYYVYIPSTSPQVVKLGWYGPLSGDAASDGTSSLDGAMLAVQQVNSAGGVLGKQFVLVKYDDQATPSQAVTIANKLTQSDHVVGVIGGSYSGATLAAGPVFQQAQVPQLISYAQHPGILQLGDYNFMFLYPGVADGRVMAWYAVNQLHYSKFAILASDSPVGQSYLTGFKTELQSLGATILFEKTFTSGTTDYSAYVSGIKSSGADVVYAGGFYYEMAPFVKQARESGLTLPILSGVSFDNPALFSIAGAQNAAGTLMTRPYAEDSNDQSFQSFKSAFSAAYNRPPDALALTSYEIVYFYAAAIKLAGSIDPTAIRDAFYKVTNFSSPAGVIAHPLPQGSRSISRPIYIVQATSSATWTTVYKVTDPSLISY